jgi:hypothetical protein
MAAPAPAAAAASSDAEQTSFLAGVPASELSPLAQQLLSTTRTLFEQTFGKQDNNRSDKQSGERRYTQRRPLHAAHLIRRRRLTVLSLFCLLCSAL